MCLRRTSDGPLLDARANAPGRHRPAPRSSISNPGGGLNSLRVSAIFEQDLHAFCKTLTENWDSKRHLLELSWPI